MTVRPRTCHCYACEREGQHELDVKHPDDVN